MEFSSILQSQSSSRSGWSSDSLKNFSQISPLVQNHLKLVYLCLVCALIASAVGVYLHVVWNIGDLITGTSMASILWLLFTSPHEEWERVAMLMAAAFFEGASVGPLIGLVMEIDPGILISGFVATAIAFGCFSAAAMLSKHRVCIYLGGLLSSVIAILVWLHFASSLFGDSVALFLFRLFPVLLLFLGYIVVDTQYIIERARLRDLDYVKHSLILFIDFFGLFIQIIKIMLEKRNEMAEREKQRVKRSRKSNQPESSFTNFTGGYASQTLKRLHTG